MLRVANVLTPLCTCGASQSPSPPHMCARSAAHVLLKYDGAHHLSAFWCVCVCVRVRDTNSRHKSLPHVTLPPPEPDQYLV